LSLKRKRVKAYVDALSNLMVMEDPSRELAINILKEALKSNGVEPFRGISNPPDIYEKELISLYVVGTRGLGIHQDYPEKFNKLFGNEVVYDEVLKVLEGDDTISMKERIKQLLGRDVSELDIAKVLRLAMVLYYLDFVSHEYVVKVLKNVSKVFPEYIETVRRFTKFFIAIKISSDIANGVIKNKMMKEINKQLLSLNVGIPKAVPSDGYIREVAKILFNIPKNVINKILK
jgi:hypothetical protein